MKREARKPFDASSIPRNLCPIAVEPTRLRTGDWRAMRPQVDRERCVKCGACWVYCPCQCIKEKATWFEADLTICKGCGVCAAECPHGAVTLVEETKE